MSYLTIGKWRAQCACRAVQRVSAIAFVAAAFVTWLAAAAALDAVALAGAVVFVFALGCGAAADYIERRLERM